MRPRFLIVAIMLLATCQACHHEARYLKEANASFQAGLELRAAANNEAATEAFSDALLAINRCTAQSNEVNRLKAQIEDNLGAMYWKHDLNKESLELHLDAVALLRELDEPTLLMTALRNCGRVKASLQCVNEAQVYYDEAWQIAKNLNDTAFCNELLMETSHDLYLESGDYQKAIENAQIALKGGADPGFCHLIIGLAHYYLGEDNEALAFLSEAAQSEKASVRMSAYQGMYVIYQSAGDYVRSLECHELFVENMMQDEQVFKREEVERIKAEYDLKMQENQLQSEQKLRNLYLYSVLVALVVALAVTLLLLRQKSLREKLKAMESKNQLELALKKNKVYLTALSLSEQITASSLDFNLKEEDWADFMKLIDMVYDGFTTKLLAKYPSLTQGDLQICCLTKQGFSNQVLAIIMNMQSASYARRKSRIKQEKMNGLQDERSFEEIISEI
ncbi:MAG: hypothetical protein IKM74_07205 [Bacteroidales bacterium]|nr:hypothetical protein [Bacteroidales bacterium]